MRFDLSSFKNEVRCWDSEWCAHPMYLEFGLGWYIASKLAIYMRYVLYPLDVFLIGIRNIEFKELKK